jgi:hypothetical protein
MTRAGLCANTEHYDAAACGRRRPVAQARAANLAAKIEQAGPAAERAAQQLSPSRPRQIAPSVVRCRIDIRADRDADEHQYSHFRLFAHDQLS